MASFNKVILIGNLTRDVELKYTPKGTAIAKLGLAVNRKWKNEAGENKEEVTFVDVDTFGRNAENAAQYLRKGSPLMVEGRLKLDTWDDKQTNQKRSKLGVVAETIQFLGQKNDSQPQPTSARRNSKASTTDSTSADGEIPEDDDVPF